MRRALAFLLLSIASTAHAAPPALPHYATFRHWTLACDNTGACEARGFDGDAADPLWLVLRRDAGAASASLSIHGLEGAIAPRALDLDGRALALGAGWTYGPDDAADGRVLATSDGAALKRFLDAARRATTVRVAGEDAVGTLAGLTAALLRMDEAQGRVGTRHALASAGASDAIAPPRPLPVLTARAWAGAQPDEAAQQRYIDAMRVDLSTCEEPTRRQGSVVAISAREVLAMLTCWRGAYQTAELVFRGPVDRPAAARPVELPVPPGDAPDAPDVPRHLVSNASFDGGVLSSYAKGRGLFDCGDVTQWAFDGERFHLAEYSLLDRCGWMAPGDFPTLVRSRVVVAEVRP